MRQVRGADPDHTLFEGLVRQASSTLTGNLFRDFLAMGRLPEPWIPPSTS